MTEEWANREENEKGEKSTQEAIARGANASTFVGSLSQ